MSPFSFDPSTERFEACPIGGAELSWAQSATGLLSKSRVSQPSASMVSPMRSTLPSLKTNRSVRALSGPTAIAGSVLTR